MAQVHVIRHKVLIEGRSQSEVAKVMGVSRQTVRKYLTEPEPQPKPRPPRQGGVWTKVKPRLEELMAEWAARTTKKQKITARRLYDELVKEGFKVGYTTVKDFFREHRRQRQEVFIPLVHRAGDEAQVDFFEVTIDENGVRRKAWKFLLRLMYSGRDFVWLYDDCDQLAFLDGHVRAFAHLDGVPARGVYDNLSAAVTRRVGLVPTLTERFRALASHYLFEPCFARPATGHDKGGVEARGKGIRWQHLTPIPDGPSRHEIAATLLAEVDAAAVTKCRPDGQAVMALFAAEQPLRRPLPPTPFDPRRLVVTSANRQALVRVGGATYSVPSTWASLVVEAKVGVDAVTFACRGEVITLPRQPRRGKAIRYRHYTRELAKKPQAVRQVAPELCAELGEPYAALWALLVATHGAPDAARVLAKLVAAVDHHGEGPVQAALKALMASPAPVSTPRVSLVEVPANLQAYTIEAGCAADYNWLLTGGVQ